MDGWDESLIENFQEHKIKCLDFGMLEKPFLIIMHFQGRRSVENPVKKGHIRGFLIFFVWKLAFLYKVSYQISQCAMILMVGPYLVGWN